MIRSTFGDERYDLLLGRCECERTRCASRDARQFGARTLGPPVGSDRLEDAPRFLERLPGRALTPESALQHTQAQQRSPTFEWSGTTVVFLQGELK